MAMCLLCYAFLLQGLCLAMPSLGASLLRCLPGSELARPSLQLAVAWLSLYFVTSWLVWFEKSATRKFLIQTVLPIMIVLVSKRRASPC